MQVFPYKLYLPDQNSGLSEGIWAPFAKKALLLGYELFQDPFILVKLYLHLSCFYFLVTETPLRWVIDSNDAYLATIYDVLFALTSK